jgi:hypothetical protein
MTMERSPLGTPPRTASWYASLLAESLTPGARVESWSWGAAALAWRRGRIECEVDGRWVRLSSRVAPPVEAADVDRLEASLRRNHASGRVRVALREGHLMLRAEYPIEPFDADDFRQLGRELAAWLRELGGGAA